MEEIDIKKILLVERPGLEQKWWHRLSNVLIFGSTIFMVGRAIQQYIKYRGDGDAFWAFLAPVLWFIFWESIVYRTLVYIILGKNKHENI